MTNPAPVYYNYQQPAYTPVFPTFAAPAIALLCGAPAWYLRGSTLRAAAVPVS
jgi:hypothetical protein